MTDKEKIRAEEPVSDSLEEELDKYIHDNFTIEKDQLDKFGIEEKDYMYSMDKGDMLAMVRYFTNICKVTTNDDLEEPVSEKDKLRALSDGKQHLGWIDDAVALEMGEELAKEVEDYIDVNGFDGLDSVEEVKSIACHFANWQKAKDSTCASDDLDKAAKEWLIPQLDKSYEPYGERMMMELTHFDGYAMLDAIEFGANWMLNKKNKTG